MTPSSDAALGRVRWKRFAAVAAPAAIGAGALVFMTAQGSIASSMGVCSAEALAFKNGEKARHGAA